MSETIPACRATEADPLAVSVNDQRIGSSSSEAKWESSNLVKQNHDEIEWDGIRATIPEPGVYRLWASVLVAGKEPGRVSVAIADDETTRQVESVWNGPGGGEAFLKMSFLTRLDEGDRVRLLVKAEVPMTVRGGGETQFGIVGPGRTRYNERHPVRPEPLRALLGR